MSLGSFNQGNPAAHGIDGPKGWAMGSDFITGAWVNDWVITENGDAAAPGAGDIVDEAKNGILLVTTGTGDNDSLAFQLGGETVKMEANEQYWCTCRIQAADVDDSDWMFGFGAYDNSDGLETPGQVVDGVYVQSLDGSTDIDFITEKAGTQVDNSGVGTGADAVYDKIDFFIDVGPVAGQGRVVCRINEIAVADYYSEVLPTEVVGPFMFFAAGAAAADTFKLDWFFCGGSDGR